MIKLVVIDLDGTLIGSDLSLGTRTIKSIEAVKKAGVNVTFATGRMVSATRIYAHELGIDLPIVGLNGALVKPLSNNECVFHAPLSSESFLKALDILATTNATTLIVDRDEAFGWNLTAKMQKILSSWICDIKEIDPTDSPTTPTIALVSGDEKPVKETAERIQKLNLPDVQVFLFPSIRYYPMWYFELRRIGVNKGTGLKALRKYLGIEKSETLAIGDFINDVPMFMEAGIRATVANAHENVLKIADYVSKYSCDNDAVADIIENLILRRV